MIKVSVFYPSGEGSTFDMKYYCEIHMPLVERLLGAACIKTGVDEGVMGSTPGSPPLYTTIGHLYFNTVEDFVSSFTPNADAILGDIPNFTNITPVSQINNVIT